MTTSSAGYAGESPEARPESIDEQVKRKGVRPVESVKDMAQDGVFESERNWNSSLRTFTPPVTLTLPDRAGVPGDQGPAR